MHTVSSKLVLLAENLSISVNDVFRILFKKVEHPDIKLFMSLDEVGIMENLVGQMTMINIHIF